MEIHSLLEHTPEFQKESRLRRGLAETAPQCLWSPDCSAPLDTCLAPRLQAVPVSHPPLGRSWVWITGPAWRYTRLNALSCSSKGIYAENLGPDHMLFSEDCGRGWCPVNALTWVRVKTRNGLDPICTVWVKKLLWLGQRGWVLGGCHNATLFTLPPTFINCSVLCLLKCLAAYWPVNNSITSTTKNIFRRC